MAGQKELASNRECRISGILVRAFDAIYAVLDECTLADLVGKRRCLRQVLMRVQNG